MQCDSSVDERDMVRPHPSARRHFMLAMLHGAAVLSPFAARAQQLTRIPRVGVLWIASQSVVAPFQDAFLQGLHEHGYVEGKTIVIVARFANGDISLLPRLAEELVKLKVDVILAPATPSLGAAKQATATIPIVMSNVSDPIGFGFVASLSRPGGNITGFANLTVEQVAKNVELCKEALPALSRLAVLVNPAAPDAIAVMVAARDAAREFRLDIQQIEARQPDEIDGAVSQAVAQGATALLVSTIEGFLFGNRIRIIEAAARYRLATVFAAPPFGLASAGALLGEKSVNNHPKLRRNP